VGVCAGFKRGSGSTELEELDDKQRPAKRRSAEDIRRGVRL
jgi:hypothetical protein